MRPQCALRFATARRHSAASPSGVSETVAQTSIVPFSFVGESPFQLKRSALGRRSTVRSTHGDWLSSVQVFVEQPSRQRMSVQNPAVPGAACPNATGSLPRRFSMPRQPKPFAAESKAMRMPRPSSRMASDGGASGSVGAHGRPLRWTVTALRVSNVRANPLASSAGPK